MLWHMDEPVVTRCPASLRSDALRRLYAAGDATQQESLALAVNAVDAADAAAWDGLLVSDAMQPAGAIWVQPTPGNTAVVWPPEPNCAAGDRLLSAAAAFVDERRIGLAQIIVAEHDGFSPEQFTRGGFGKLADLQYLFAEVDATRPEASSPIAAPQTPSVPGVLKFHPGADDDPARLATLVEQTYIGTQDCPALDGTRSIADVLAGYRQQGEYMPQHWYSIDDESHQRRPVGVLLLANHPASGNWELVYMGVTPAARGRGFGDRIVRFAVETAGRCGAQRLVLAVDAANKPALAVYRRAGFVEWDRRTVYGRLTAARVAAPTS